MREVIIIIKMAGRCRLIIIGSSIASRVVGIITRTISYCRSVAKMRGAKIALHPALFANLNHTIQVAIHILQCLNRAVGALFVSVDSSHGARMQGGNAYSGLLGGRASIGICDHN